MKKMFRFIRVDPAVCNLRHVFSHFKHVYRDKAWWKAWCIEVFIGALLHRWFVKNNGVFVMEQDWDNFIILDGCRYDLLAEMADFGGPVQYRISRGSDTRDFVWQNFSGKKFMDTVYVTANPYIDLLAGDSFFKIYPVWKTHWDTQHNTVLAEDVLKVAYQAYAEHRDKRIIIHFMQPHAPFLQYPQIKGGVAETRKALCEGRGGAPGINPWLSLWRGDISLATFRKAYKSNLAYVLPSIKDLLEHIPGKSVISADHGNAFGERIPPFPLRMYGHKPYIRIESLVKVPWIEVENGRRTIQKGIDKGAAPNKEKIIEERLKSLGYL